MPRCRNCGEPVEGPRNRQYCSDRCRAIAWRGRQAKDQADREGRVRMLLVEALRVLGGRGEP